MEAENKFEFEQLKKEEQRNKDCIAEYITIYYQVVGVAMGLLVAAVGYFIVQNNADLFKMVHLSVYQLLGFGVFAVCFVLQTFALIILHKCNTHNKIAGYLRVLTREKWALPARTDKSRKDNVPKDLFLWEAIQQRLGKREGKQVYKFPNAADLDYVLTEATWGVWNLFFVPLKKLWVKDSWAYPVSLSFGLHAPVLAAMLGWFFYIRPHLCGGSYSVVIVQWGLCAYLFFSFLGNMVRVALLCHDDKPRTIGRYASFFEEKRTLLLKSRYGIIVERWDDNWDPNTDVLRAQIRVYEGRTECYVIYAFVPTYERVEKDGKVKRVLDSKAARWVRCDTVFSCAKEAEIWLDALAKRHGCKTVNHVKVTVPAPHK